jgi:IclR family transcriptional regulator, KDG regulon repressor
MKKITYSAPSVKKAFKILQVITDSASGLGVSELAERLKIGKSTVHGITLALEGLGVLVRDPQHKKYTIGYTLLELGRRAYGRMELRDIARGPMERLMEEVGETVFLGVWNRDHITILDMVESRNQLKITSPPGTRLPLLAAATGKVFLSQVEEEKAKEIIQKMGLHRYTMKSVVDPKAFAVEVEQTRKRGYALDDEEYLLGVRAVAAPLALGPYPPSAIWVVGFSSSLHDRKVEKVVAEIRKTTQEITRNFEKIAHLRGTV